MWPFEIHLFKRRSNGVKIERVLSTIKLYKEGRILIKLRIPLQNVPFFPHNSTNIVAKNLFTLMRYTYVTIMTTLVALHISDLHVCSKLN